MFGLKTADLAAAQEKQMEVCDTCGAFLIVGDAQSRIDDHLMGKQHMGYARLRSAIEEIQVHLRFHTLHPSSFSPYREKFSKSMSSQSRQIEQKQEKKKKNGGKKKGKKDTGREMKRKGKRNEIEKKGGSAEKRKKRP